MADLNNAIDNLSNVGDEDEKVMPINVAKYRFISARFRYLTYTELSEYNMRGTLLRQMLCAELFHKCSAIVYKAALEVVEKDEVVIVSRETTARVFPEYANLLHLYIDNYANHDDMLDLTEYKKELERHTDELNTYLNDVKLLIDKGIVVSDDLD